MNEYVYIYVHLNVSEYVCVYVGLCVRTYVCIYVCMNVCKEECACRPYIRFTIKCMRNKIRTILLCLNICQYLNGQTLFRSNVSKEDTH